MVTGKYEEFVEDSAAFTRLVMGRVNAFVAWLKKDGQAAIWQGNPRIFSQWIQERREKDRDIEVGMEGSA